MYNFYALINLISYNKINSRGTLYKRGEGEAMDCCCESKCTFLRIAQNCTLHAHSHSHAITQTYILVKLTSSQRQQQRRRRRIAVETVPGRVSLAVYMHACMCATRAQKCVKVFWIICCAALTFTNRSDASVDSASNSTIPTSPSRPQTVYIKLLICCCCNHIARVVWYALFCPKLQRSLCLCVPYNSFKVVSSFNKIKYAVYIRMYKIPCKRLAINNKYVSITHFKSGFGNSNVCRQPSKFSVYITLLPWVGYSSVVCNFLFFRFCFFFLLNQSTLK